MAAIGHVLALLWGFKACLHPLEREFFRSLCARKCQLCLRTLQNRGKHADGVKGSCKRLAELLDLWTRLMRQLCMVCLQPPPGESAAGLASVLMPIAPSCQEIRAGAETSARISVAQVHATNTHCAELCSSQ